MVNDHTKFFSDCFSYLSEDVVYNQRRLVQNEDVLFSDDEVLNYTLINLESILNENNRSLVDFPSLPQINHLVMITGRNRLIAGERIYNVQKERTRFNDLYSHLNTRQKEVYTTIINAINTKKEGWRDRENLWKTLIASIGSHGKIVLFVASSGIAFLLLPGGHTTHSRFQILLAIDEHSCCSIDVGSDLAELINIVELIIWDYMSAELQVFGGKVVVFGGDFQHILPVIPFAPCSEIVASVVNKSSTIWNACKVLF
ncbi:hypothetical protein OSB04_027993 [Centaurea solstitialis]|uniref:ATP-dependent DNA helicase n=1 Tax=Centaurea solstitialis TaxID=347529 RepID=A0AA38W075_9ASTR|nr:hypothetical protein OSB04_027993 [Centaurea solstitialis]